VLLLMKWACSMASLSPSRRIRTTCTTDLRSCHSPLVLSPPRLIDHREEAPLLPAVADLLHHEGLVLEPLQVVVEGGLEADPDVEKATMPAERFGRWMRNWTRFRPFPSPTPATRIESSGPMAKTTSKTKSSFRNPPSFVRT